MIEILLEENEIILKLPKELISAKYIQKFLERVKVESIAQKSKLTERESITLSEEIKRNWWDKNKDKFLGKIKN